MAKEIQKENLLIRSHKGFEQCPSEPGPDLFIISIELGRVLVFVEKVEKDKRPDLHILFSFQVASR